MDNNRNQPLDNKEALPTQTGNLSDKNDLRQGGIVGGADTQNTATEGVGYENNNTGEGYAGDSERTGAGLGNKGMDTTDKDFKKGGI